MLGLICCCRDLRHSAAAPCCTCTVTVAVIQMVETLGPLPRPLFSQGKFYEQLKRFTHKDADQSDGNFACHFTLFVFYAPLAS